MAENKFKIGEIVAVSDKKENILYTGMVKGWVKIHGDIIHYDGYSQKPMVRITEKQREQLVRYGNVCHRGFLKFGYRFNQISMIMFSSIEPLMLGKLFEL